MVSYLEEKQIQVHVELVKQIVQLTKAIKTMTEEIHELKTELEIANGLKRNGL